jgi:oligopeptide transport system ATP-binding protein
MRISDQLVEPLLVHERIDRSQALKKAVESLEEMGIPDASRRINLYPHQFSGGMRQRVMIAMALISRPEILIADEPTTALDVTVQAQILDLIKQRQKDLGTAVIFITHDLSVVSSFCEHVSVMYAGRFVESAPTAELFWHPMHPYSASLQQSIPALHKKGQPLYTIPGLPPDLTLEVQGCPFAPRCGHAADVCREQKIELQEITFNHATACVRFQRGELAGIPLASATTVV